MFRIRLDISHDPDANGRRQCTDSVVVRFELRRFEFRRKPQSMIFVFVNYSYRYIIIWISSCTCIYFQTFPGVPNAVLELDCSSSRNTDTQNTLPEKQSLNDLDKHVSRLIFGVYTAFQKNLGPVPVVFTSFHWHSRIFSDNRHMLTWLVQLWIRATIRPV